MTLVSLNIWGGKLFGPLMDFVKKHAKNTDVFCFQEVFDSSAGVKPISRGCRSNMYAELERNLQGFRGYFGKTEEGWDFDGPVTFPLALGQAAFVKKNLEVRSHRLIPVVSLEGNKPINDLDRPRGLQDLEIKNANSTPFHVLNFHGLLDAGHKRDTAERLAQFARVQQYLAEIKNRIILCGDFNTRPDTQSIQSFQKTMRNLWQEYGQPWTRNANYADMEKFADYYGDFIFTTPDIQVDTFAALEDVVSDHLPLMLEFS